MVQREQKIDYIIRTLATNHQLNDNVGNFDSEKCRITINKLSDHWLDIFYEKYENISKTRLVYEKINTIMTCPVTMEWMSEPWSIYGCNHTFDKRTISILLNGNARCPLCRKQFNKNQTAACIKINKIINSWSAVLTCANNAGLDNIIFLDCELKQNNPIKIRKYRQYILVYVDESKYIGMIKDTLKGIYRHGHGEMIYGSGDKYEGMWKNNLRVGTSYTHLVIL